MPTLNADQNLLFGFMALQVGLLSREDLIAATSVWLQDKSQPLDQILLERGLLSEDNHQMLLPLVRHHLAKHEGDAEKSLAAIDAVSSVREELLRLGDDDLEASLVQATQNREARSEVSRTIAWSPSSPDTRYQVLRPHAKGGLGLVSVALDEELKREVAFKEIQEKYADDEDGRARFVREAEITGGLEHPGIVPVYGLGHYEDGRPFYAMRLVKGKNLRDAIKQFHNAKQEQSQSSERSLAFRQLLGQFIDVCNAIEYAHSRGILHRDIKPANVMLGKYGETLVVDWGLAKTIGRSDEHRSRGEETLQPTSGGDSSQTKLGSAVGTPSFMSPEQAAGRLDDLSPTSDVYSLGATLYCILTGQPPLHDTDAGTAIRKAEKGDFPPPREIKSSIPAVLEAVCLKAMALKPEDRYASASLLTADIERWLADEPVDAYHESFADRAARCVRRHRSWVLAGAVATLLITVCSIAAALFINKARKQETTQREVAERKSRELETQLRVSTVTRLAAQAQAIRDESPVRSLLLAREAVETSRRDGGSILPVAHETLLSAATNLGGRPLVGHEGRIWSMAISSDGRTLATIGGVGDGTVRLWDLTTVDPGASPTVLKGHTGGIWSVAMSRDDRWLVTGSYDNTARLWDLASAETASTSQVLKGHTGWVTSVAISPDGRWVVTGSLDNTARLWDLKAADPGSSSIVLEKHSESIGTNSVAISADSRWLVTGSNDDTARLWDLNSTNPASSSMVLGGHTGDIRSVAISPNGHWVVTTSMDNTARLWDLTAKNPASSSITFGGLNYNRSVTISPDSRWLVTGSNDATVRMWDLTAKDPTSSSRVLRGHEGARAPVAMSPNGRWLVTGSGQNSANVWDLTAADVEASSLVLRGHEDLIASIAICPNSRWLVTGGYDHTARLWDLNSQHPASPTVLQGFDDRVDRVTLSADGRSLVTQTRNGKGRVWDANTEGPAESALVGRGYNNDTDSVVMSSDGRWLLSTSLEDAALLLDLTAESQPGTLLAMPSGEHRIREIAVSPDGRWLAARKLDEAALLWDVTKPSTSPRDLPGYQKSMFHSSILAISPNGRWLVMVGLDHFVRLLDLVADDPMSALLELPGHEDGIYCLAISPDSRWLVTGSQDRKARRWDLTADDPAAASLVLQGHTVSVVSLAISPDGRWLVTGSWDHTARRWDLNAADPNSSSVTLTGHTAALGSVAISSDNRWVVTGDAVGSVRRE